MARVPATPPPSSSSIASTVKAYSLPLVLFAGALFYQLFVIPNAFPPSHYDVLKIESHSSVEKVKEAYEELESKWKSDVEVSDTPQFLKIRYAYELLSNPLWKRDYDIFGIDEQHHVIETVSKRYMEKSIAELDFPLLDAPSSESVDHSFKVITASDVQSLFLDAKPWLIQLHSFGSKRCAQFFEVWGKIASSLDGIANIGMVELGEVQLAIYLADKRSTGKPYFRNGLPSLIAIPPGCRAANCFTRFDGELSVDAVTDWFATTVLALPQIMYHSKQSLVPHFIAKTSPHKVKVIFFSKTGERAAPSMRQAAKDYWAYASFAFILWREEDSSDWWTAFGVESAPAIVFLKGPGVKPVVHHGSVNNSLFLNLMESNKQQELRQLRSTTSMELGCDPRGYSRAGYDTAIWYCAIAVGRLSLELNKMRETLYRAEETLSKYKELDASNEDQSLAPAVDAFKRKRLTFTWLDGEKQEAYCHFYLGSAASIDTCGQQRGVVDEPRLFIIRYLRNTSYENTRTQEMTKWKSLLVQDMVNDEDHVGQFVARYDGATDDASQIMQWIASIIADGDSRDLPFFKFRSPKLVPDEAEPVWSRTAQIGLLKSMKLRILKFVTGIYDYLDDPRIGPTLLLAALVSLGTIWLRRSQPVQPPRPNRTSPEANSLDETERRQRLRERVRTRSNKDRPTSITDLDPPDAYQMPLSDSD